MNTRFCDTHLQVIRLSAGLKAPCRRVPGPVRRSSGGGGGGGGGAGDGGAGR